MCLHMNIACGECFYTVTMEVLVMDVVGTDYIGSLNTPVVLLYRSLCETFMIVKGEDKISKQANENATMLMKCLVRSMLCSRQVVEEHRLTAEAFDWLVGMDFKLLHS